MVECWEIGISRTQEFSFMRFGNIQQGQSSQRIRIPASGVQRFRDIEMVKRQKRPHEIMEDGAVRRQTPKNLDLLKVKGFDLIRTEPPKIQNVRRIRFGHSQIGQLD